MSRLKAIVARVGGVLYDGGRRALVPGPGHSPRDRSVSLLETRDGHVIVHCFSPKDDPRLVVAWLADLGVNASALPDDSAVTPRARDTRMRARRLWGEARPIVGTLAERYLRARGVVAPMGGAALRYGPRASSLDDRRRRPALLAAIADRKGDVQGIEIHLLAPDGARMAHVPTPRRIVGKLSDGAVRLGEPGETLLIAEGVVTALSAAEALQSSAWAALSAHNLARFTPPDGVRRLIVAADNDAAGLAAAERVWGRLNSRLAVEIAPPPAHFNDWNDWLRDRRARG